MIHSLKKFEEILMEFQEFKSFTKVNTSYLDTYLYFSDPNLIGLYINIKFPLEIGKGIHISVRNKFLNNQGYIQDYVLNTVDRQNIVMHYKTGYIKKSNKTYDNLRKIIKDGIAEYNIRVKKMKEFVLGDYRYIGYKSLSPSFDNLLIYMTEINKEKDREKLLDLILNLKWKKVVDNIDICELKKHPTSYIKQQLKLKFLECYNIDFRKFQ